ncbi:lysine decarboxylase-like protein, putative [Plasmodium chabaudi chabaudi]|uniref:Lysine decarboxylase-like protein, putative n=1 Tax=Plasmodium chabaudi chabaudi TaxID=31271 RepID=A0A1D3LDP4_PLACU|nr:lysine decarboxylase-like protein, putative [Plasmodium chabaudi chabaudi]
MKLINENNNNNNILNLDAQIINDILKENFQLGKEGRLARILSEFFTVQDCLRNEGIFFTIVIFGSSRAISNEKYESNKIKYENQLKEFNQKQKDNIPLSDTEIKQYEQVKNDLDKLEKLKWSIKYYSQISELCKKLSLFFETEEGQDVVKNMLPQLPKNHPLFKNKNFETQENGKIKQPNKINVAVCTGGGPGFMEAANKGSKEANGRSLGFSIKLPFEKGPNPYIDENLSFVFHYFFTRKFWLVYLSLAFIIMPGGFGTLDELMEILALKQCKKFKREVPIVLFGKQFWKSIVNFDMLVEYGLAHQEDVDSLFMTDSVDEAYECVINFLKNSNSTTPKEVKDSR